ncbi:hypothetical protein J6590_019595 [Homalodisca vitripennis]|nr:hypothetical protein J6590_019595 [Homalodisca vitripennis]
MSQKVTCKAGSVRSPARLLNTHWKLEREAEGEVLPAGPPRDTTLPENRRRHPNRFSPGMFTVYNKRHLSRPPCDC